MQAMGHVMLQPNACNRPLAEVSSIHYLHSNNNNNNRSTSNNNNNNNNNDSTHGMDNDNDNDNSRGNNNKNEQVCPPMLEIKPPALCSLFFNLAISLRISLHRLDKAGNASLQL